MAIFAKEKSNLFEDHGFVAVQENAVFAVPLHCTCQHLTFGIAPLGGEVFNGF
jgi:hypothetical protein